MTPVDLVTPGYFDCIGSSLLGGRDFQASDDDRAAPVAIVNRAFAEQHGGIERTLGRRISLGGPPDRADITIVGIAGDIKDRGPRERAGAHVYRPFAQAAPQMTTATASVTMRTGAGAPIGIEDIRRVVAAHASAFTLYDWRPLEDRLSTMIAPERYRSYGAQTIAWFAQVIAGLGIFSMLHLHLVERRRQLAIRVAIGASRRDVASWTMGTVATPPVFGVAMGWAAAVTLAALPQPAAGTDAARFVDLVIALTALAGVVTVATVLPVRTALRTSPAELLRATSWRD